MALSVISCTTIATRNVCFGMIDDRAARRTLLAAWHYGSTRPGSLSNMMADCRGLTVPQVARTRCQVGERAAIWTMNRAKGSQEAEDLTSG
jgi:hypothetical protein